MRRILMTLCGTCCWLSLTAVATAQQTSYTYIQNWSPKKAITQCVTAGAALVNELPPLIPPDNSCVDPFSTDADVARASGVASSVEAAFAGMANWMAKGQLHNPDFLRPVTSSKLILFADKRVDLAEHRSPCSVNPLGQAFYPGDFLFQGDYGGTIRYDPNDSLFRSPGVAKFVVTHETAHAVQHASGFAKSDPQFCAGTAGGDILNWVIEGTADVLAWEYVRTQSEWNLVAITTHDYWPEVAGLRPYYFPLPFHDANSKNRASPRYRNNQYRVSAFWRQIAWRYHDDDIFYLKDYFSKAIEWPYDWTEWADDLITNDSTINAPDPKNPSKKNYGFYFAYPTFIADWAGMHDNVRFKNSGTSRPRWRGPMFGSCKDVRLSRTQPDATLSIDLHPLAAKCIRVKFTEMRDGDKASLRIAAHNVKNPDQFHLSEIERFGKYWSLCSDQLDKKIAKGSKIFSGQCMVDRIILSGDLFIPQTIFQPEPFYDGGVGSWITFALSRVSLSPSDDYAKKEPITVRLEFKTNFGEIAMGSSGQQAIEPLVINSTAWSDTALPIDVEPELLAMKEGKVNMPGAQAMYNALPNATTMFNTVNPFGQTAWGMSFATYDVKVNNGPYGPTGNYDLTDSYHVFLEPGTKLADGQSYQGMIQYVPKGQPGPMGMGASPPSDNQLGIDPLTLTVKHRSADRLTVEFNGPICLNYQQALVRKMRKLRPYCQNVEQISGTLSIAYPDLYEDGRELIYDMQSEGNLAYRDQQAAAMNAELSKIFGPQGVPPGAAAPSAGSELSAPTGTGSSSTNTIPACDCSCTGFQAMQNLSKSITPAQAMALNQCVTQCTTAYVQCAMQGAERKIDFLSALSISA